MKGLSNKLLWETLTKHQVLSYRDAVRNKIRSSHLRRVRVRNVRTDVVICKASGLDPKTNTYASYRRERARSTVSESLPHERTVKGRARPFVDSSYRNTEINDVRNNFPSYSYMETASSLWRMAEVGRK